MNNLIIDRSRLGEVDDDQDLLNELDQLESAEALEQLELNKGHSYKARAQ